MKDLAKIGGLLLIGGALAFAFTRALPSSLDLEIAATRDTIRITDSVYVTQTDTVVKWQRRVDTVRARSDSLDSLVTIKDDSTLIVRPSLKDSTGNFNDSLRSFPSDTMPTVVHIPPVVVANLAALRLTVASQDTLIRALYQRDTTQQWRIQSRDNLIRALNKQAHPTCGRRCGFVLGAASVAGLVYLVK